MNRSVIFTAAHKSAKESYAKLRKFNNNSSYAQCFKLALRKTYKAYAKAVKISINANDKPASDKQLSYLSSMISNVPANITLIAASEAIQARKFGQTVFFI
jgi:hypothetical protein